MVKFLKLLIIIFFILFLIENIKCIDIIDSEKQCLLDIGVKTNSSLNVPNVESLICNGMVPSCVCNVDGYLINIFVESKTTNTLVWSDFTCFTKLNYIYIYNSVVDENLIYGPFPPPLSYLIVHSPSLKPIDRIIPKLVTLDIWFLNQTPFILKASFIKNISTFRINGLDIDLDVDVNSTETVLQELTIQTTNIPNITNLTNLRTVSFGAYNGLNNSSYSNLISYNKIGSIFFSGGDYDFPSELGDIINPFLTFFYFSSGKFNPAKKLIDFSNNNNSDVSINIACGKKFNYNGLFPFSGFPRHNKFISFSNGNFSMLPDLNLFKNTISLSMVQCEMSGTLPSIANNSILTTINLKSNKLTGSIDESWCLKDLDLLNNRLTGDLPYCIYCYLNISSIAAKFAGNLFSNYLTNNRDCSYEQISAHKFILGKNGVITLLGKNMGVSLGNIKTIPNIRFTINNYNDSFSGIFEPLVNISTIKEVKVQFLVPDLNFTISLGSPPFIDSIVQNNYTLIINGSYFSYDISAIKVNIGDGIGCIVKSSTFNQIQCEIDYPVFESGNKLVFVYVDTLNTSKVFDLKSSIPCLDCSIHGVCNSSTGNCDCQNDYITIGENVCIIPKHYLSETTKVLPDEGGIIELKGWYGDVHEGLEVLIDNVNMTVISVTTNIIQISIGTGFGPKNLSISQNGYNWNGIIYPYSDIIHGECDDSSPVKCICDDKWATVGNQICSVPNHYVSSSTKVPSNIGGNITLGGWFGYFHLNIKVSVSGSGVGADLPIYSIDNETISTLIGQGSGELIIIVTQNNLSWSGSIYPYLDESINCLNDCNGGAASNNGVCNTTTGQCICKNGYLGLDCGIKPPTNGGNSQNQTQTEINPDGSTLITNQGVGYLIYIDSISEIDFNNNLVENSTINLKTGWIADKTTTTNVDQDIAIFRQQIKEVVLITMTIEQIKNVESKQFSFAGNQFTINKGGFKLSLSVSNWNYKSNLNTLQIEMSSDIVIDESNENGCDESTTTDIETSSNSNQLKDNLNYLKVIRDGIVLYGRFQNKMLSDGKSTTTITKLKSKDEKSVKIILDLPHCSQCLIDPDFSVMLDTHIIISKSNSCNKNNSKKWLLPVAIILPVTGVAFIISGIVLHKKKISQKKFINNLKLKNLN